MRNPIRFIVSMKRKAQAALADFVLFTVSAATSDPITYAGSIFGSSASEILGIGGSITTDRTLGLITASAINPSGTTFFNLVNPLSGEPKHSPAQWPVLASPGLIFVRRRWSKLGKIVRGARVRT
jgi:hypothetical protein